MNNVIENAMDKNLISIKDQMAKRQKASEDAYAALCAMAGLDLETAKLAGEKIANIEVDKIQELTKEELTDIYSAKGFATLSKAVKLKPEEQRVQFIRDYTGTVKEHQAFEANLEKETEDMLKSNDKFNEDMDKLIKEIHESSETLEESLERQMAEAKDDAEKHCASEFLKAYNDVLNLKMFNSVNTKRLLKLLRDTKKYSDIKIKAMKLFSNKGMGNLDFNHFQNCILSFLDTQFLDMPVEKKNKLTLTLCAVIYMKVAGTKHVDDYKLGEMVMLKNFMSTLVIEDKDIDNFNKIPAKAFRISFKTFISEFK